jgi:PAS domain S-box-containing protein
MDRRDMATKKQERCPAGRLRATRERRPATVKSVLETLSALAQAKKRRLTAVVARQAEAALRAEEAELQLIANATPVLLTRVGRDLRYLFVNRACAELFGRPPEEIIGRSVVEIVGDKAFEAICPYIERVLKGERVEYESEIPYKGTHARFMRVTYVPERDGRGEVTGWIGSIEDVTERRQAEQAARQSDLRYRKLFEAAPDAIVVIKDGRFLDFNDAAVRLLGASSSPEMAAHSVLDFFRSKDRGQARERMCVAATDVAMPMREGVLRRLDGRELVVEFHTVAMDFHGVQAVQTVIHDVTDRKRSEQALRDAGEDFRAQAEEMKTLNDVLQGTQDELRCAYEDLCMRERDLRTMVESLRRSEERFRQVAGCAGEFIWEVDATGVYTYASPTVETILGYRPEELVGKKRFYDLFRPEERDGLRAAVSERIAHGESLYRFVNSNVHKDGRLVILETSAVPVRNPKGDLVGYRGADMDVTERKQAEEALHELNATLENKVAQRTKELAYRAKQLQKLTLELTQAEEEERRRIAQILHEDLQQQIAGARFQLSLVKKRAGDDGLRATIEATDQMLRDAIEKSRRLSHDLSPAVVNANDAAEVLTWLANRMRTEHGLNVHVQTQGDMMLESEALAIFLFRVTQELLFNVIKHAQVREAAVGMRRIGRYVCVSVTDRGRGFDLKELKEAAGIGLFSIRERAELLGGRLQVKSVKGRGSKLTIVVPDGMRVRDKGERRDDVACASASAAPTSRALRVLLVDDHAAVRAGLAGMLRDAPGIELVGEAPDGHQAIDLAGALRPDVIIMDVSMPMMKGDEATRRIKTHWPAIRVIGLSMYDEPDKKEKMFEAGADDYILKTVSADELIAAIHGTAATRRQ